MALYKSKSISMIITKKQVFQKIDKSEFLSRKGRFTFRVCKLIKDGEFDSMLSSQNLTDLLNEGPGKKVRTNNLTASMEPLLDEDVVKILIYGKGKNKRKYWRPGWIDKKIAKDKLPLLLSENNLLFLTGKNTWTDPNENFPRIIKMLDGNLCIVDRYYGDGTLYTLRKFGKTRKIKFLSAELGRKEREDKTNFDISLRKFKRQFGNIKLKKYNKPEELHDRYIIAKNALVIIGHGLKDLGDRESFVIFLPSKTVSKFLPTLKDIFIKRWKKSNYITNKNF